MKLGIIGSGNIGKNIGKWVSKLGYEVIFASRNPGHAEEAARESGNNSKSGSIKDVFESAEMVLLAVPYPAVKDIFDEAGSLLRGKVLIDATNPLNKDYSGLTTGLNTSAAEEIQRMAPEAKVVKAFNSIFASVFESQHSEMGGKKVAAFIAADDSAAKGKVSDLITTMGFEPVDAGSLKSARTLEPLALLNVTLGYGMGYGTSIGFALLR